MPPASPGRILLPISAACREAILYPALGLIETTNISVGRGTDTPFEYVGAPWIDGPALARTLECQIPARSALSCRWTSRPSRLIPYADQLCHGIELVVTDRNVLDSPELGLEIAAAIHKLYGDKFQLNKIDTLLANQKRARRAAGRSTRFRNASQRTGRQQLQDFEGTSRKTLLCFTDGSFAWFDSCKGRSYQTPGVTFPMTRWVPRCLMAPRSDNDECTQVSNLRSSQDLMD